MLRLAKNSVWQATSRIKCKTFDATYHVTWELPVPMREELPTVEDLQEVINKLHLEMKTLR